MIVHIGWDTCVESEDILAILDKRLVLQAPKGASAQLLLQAKRTGRFIPCKEGERAYVVIEKDGKTFLYASALHTVTLRKRIQAHGLHDMEQIIWHTNAARAATI